MSMLPIGEWPSYVEWRLEYRQFGSLDWLVIDDLPVASPTPLNYHPEFGGFFSTDGGTLTLANWGAGYVDIRLRAKLPPEFDGNIFACQMQNNCFTLPGPPYTNYIYLGDESNYPTNAARSEIGVDFPVYDLLVANLIFSGWTTIFQTKMGYDGLQFATGGLTPVLDVPDPPAPSRTPSTSVAPDLFITLVMPCVGITNHCGVFNRI